MKHFCCSSAVLLHHYGVLAPLKPQTFEARVECFCSLVIFWSAFAFVAIFIIVFLFIIVTLIFYKFCLYNQVGWAAIMRTQSPDRYDSIRITTPLCYFGSLVLPSDVIKRGKWRRSVIQSLLFFCLERDGHGAWQQHQQVASCRKLKQVNHLYWSRK